MAEMIYANDLKQAMKDAGMFDYVKTEVVFKSAWGVPIVDAEEVVRCKDCAYCKYNDGAVYTSSPPKYRCSVTGEYHFGDDNCNVEFAPVKHGRWIDVKGYYGVLVECSACKDAHSHTTIKWNYCPNCGARMDGGEE